MKNLSRAFSISLVVLFSLVIPSFASDGTNVKSAREIVNQMAHEQFERVVLSFDSTMKKAAPVDRLRAIWASLLGQTGKFQQQLGDTSFAYGEYDIVLVTCKFERSTLDMKLVFDKNNRVAGLFFVPHVQPQNQSSESKGASEESSGPAGGKDKLPYTSEDVNFANSEASVTLTGTLTMPKAGGNFPAVVLIAGSGPNDRNETVAGHSIFKVLADYLTRHGIAVLRYDKRGVGKSTGNYSSATTVDFASDALAAVRYLTTLKRIDHARIGLIGHSEGGEIAPIVAAETPDVSFIVLMGAPGLPGNKIILSQIALINKASGASESSIRNSLKIERKLLDIAETEKDSLKAARSIETELMKSEGADSASAELSASQLLSPWVRDFISYDPAPALKKVRCPVLALWGSKDLQVPPSQNLPAVKKALTQGGNRRFKVVVLNGLNHLFQKAGTGSPIEYGAIKETISPTALRDITGWILKESRHLH